MIIRSEHEFGEGMANSRIHAKWVAQIDAASDTSSGDGAPTQAVTSTKCGLYARTHGLDDQAIIDQQVEDD